MGGVWGCQGLGIGGGEVSIRPGIGSVWGGLRDIDLGNHIVRSPHQSITLASQLRKGKALFGQYL